MREATLAGSAHQEQRRHKGSATMAALRRSVTRWQGQGSARDFHHNSPLYTTFHHMSTLNPHQIPRNSPEDEKIADIAEL